jgi:hypothetical protein
MTGRRILLTGLPAGAGCSSLAIELAQALAGLGRSVAVAGSLKGLPVTLAQRPAGRSPHGVVFGLGGGAAYIPLEMLQPRASPAPCRPWPRTASSCCWTVSRAWPWPIPPGTSWPRK